MNRIKSAALTTVCVILAFAVLGFFASIGLALLGGLVAIGVTAALVGWIGSLFATKDTDAPVAA